MTVYVDKETYRSGHKVMCIMSADSISELRSMAEDIGVDDSHFRDSHYLVTKAKRTWALKLGAVEVAYPELLPAMQLCRDEVWFNKVSRVWERSEMCNQCFSCYKGETSAAGDDPSECGLLEIGSYAHLKNCPGVTNEI